MPAPLPHEPTIKTHLCVHLNAHQFIDTVHIHKHVYTSGWANHVTVKRAH